MSFLDVAPGMTVIVQHDFQIGEKSDRHWWMGQVLTTGGAARDPSVFNLVQIINIDTGQISWVNADLIVQILPEPQAS